MSMTGVYTVGGEISAQPLNDNFEWCEFNMFNTSRYFGFGKLTGDTKIHSQETKILTANYTDAYAAAITIEPLYSGAYTVTRHNYFNVKNIATGSGAAVTDACLFRFDAALGTHQATTGDSDFGTIKVNANGTKYYIPVFNNYNTFYLKTTTTTADSKALNLLHSGAIVGTGYTLYVSKTGASTTNVAGYFTASGATTNWGLYVAAGNAYFNNSIGIANTALNTWFTSLVAIQLGGNACIFADSDLGTSNELYITQNAYVYTDGNYRRISADEATMYRQTGGNHEFYVAGSSAADTAIIWNTAMIIDNANNVLINNASVGTNGTAVIALKTGVAPTTSPADEIQIFSIDISAGNATLGLRSEAAVIADTDESKFSDKWPVKINGTTYYIMLTQT